MALVLTVSLRWWASPTTVTMRSISSMNWFRPLRYVSQVLKFPLSPKKTKLVEAGWRKLEAEAAEYIPKNSLLVFYCSSRFLFRRSEMVLGVWWAAEDEGTATWEDLGDCRRWHTQYQLTSVAWSLAKVRKTSQFPVSVLSTQLSRGFFFFLNFLNYESSVRHAATSSP